MQELDIEHELGSALERQLSRMHPFNESWNEIAPRNLAESIRYSLLSPGKRIRPRLMLACGRMLELNEKTVLPAALALEMIHCFTLIHDDLPCMDNDDFRRGRPSNHKVHGESLALLAGDALISIAFDTFTESAAHIPANHFLRAFRRFNAAIGPRGVIGGQAAEALLNQNSTIEDMSRMHDQKTGALFQAAILVPMDLAGIEETTPQGRALETFARELGLAFQIADDLEDAAEEDIKPTSILFYLSPEETRKRTLHRLEEATRSVLLVWPSAENGLGRIAIEIAHKIRKTETTTRHSH